MKSKGKTMTLQSLALGTLAFLALGCSNMIYTLRPMTLDTNKATASGEQIEANIAWASLNSKSSVYNDFFMPELLSGSTITWSSADGSISTNGPEALVERPTDASKYVTLTATISYGIATVTKTVRVFVRAIPKAPGVDTVVDQAIVDEAKASLAAGGSAFGFSAGQGLSSATSSIAFPSTGPDGTSISWETSDPSVIGPDGTLVRPPAGSGSKTVKVTAKIRRGNTIVTETYEITVPEAPASPAEAVAADAASLAPEFAGSDMLTHVTADLSLPSFGASGTVIKWTSSNPAIIGADGLVTRPADANATVTLSAEITKNGVTETTTFTVLVAALPSDPALVLRRDKANLVPLWKAGDSPGSVTGPMDLPTSGPSGSTITWATVPTAVIDPLTGNVVRGATDTAVTLTATISYGKAPNTKTETKTFELSVLKIPTDPAVAVKEDAASIAIGYPQGDSSFSITDDIKLPTIGDDGSIITWTSSAPNLVGTGGTVTRPSYTAGDKTVTLTALVQKGGETVIRTFTVTVGALPKTATDVVAADKASLEIRFASGDTGGTGGKVTAALSLPTTGPSGSTITWVQTSPDPATTPIIDTDPVGGLGGITKPATATTVTLTATISSGTGADLKTETKTFTFVVEPKPTASADIVAQDAAVLEPVFGTGESGASVTKTISLPTTGVNNSTITWAVSPTGVIATPSGTITRPSLASGDAIVVLTATITSGTTTTTKTFTVKVEAIDPATPAEKALADKAAAVLGFDSGDGSIPTGGTYPVVTGPLTLPSIGPYGSTITWTQTTPATPVIVYTDPRLPTTGFVKRPDADTTVTLTATISSGTGADKKTETKTITVTVTAPNPAYTPAQKIAEDAVMAAPTFASGDGTNAVTNNFTLPSVGPYGTNISWAVSKTASSDTTVLALPSSNPTAPAAWDVTVTRPAIGQPDVYVIVTPTYTNGSTTVVGVPTYLKVKALGSTGTVALTINFTAPNAPTFSITPTTAIKLNKYAGAPESIAVSAASGFTSYQWVVNGAVVSTTAAATISSAGLPTGPNKAALFAMKDGVLWEADFTFTVVEE
ncbi:MAG: immunoglobulin-like domain-containing protein [Spirochaetota bacterium]